MQPVIIGGVGGSGTRIFAQFAMDLGVWFGNALNTADDNLWFQFLLKRPGWLKQKPADAEISQGLKTLEKLVQGRYWLSPGQLAFILSALKDRQRDAHLHYAPTRNKIYSPDTRMRKMEIRTQPPSSVVTKLGRLRRIAASKMTSRRNKALGYGWKDPSTFLFLPHFQASFRDVRYIHVMRHGLDMALSRNQSQVLNFGHLFGLSIEEVKTDLPRYALKYWVRANRWVLEEKKKWTDDRFLVVHYELAVEDALESAQSLAKFLQIEPDRKQLEQMVSRVHAGTSIGRYRNVDLSMFDGDDLNALGEFGYQI